MVVSSLIVGFGWALWHLPLRWTAGITLQQLPWLLLIVDITAKSVLFTRGFQYTSGRVLIAAILHGASNLFVVSARLLDRAGLDAAHPGHGHKSGAGAGDLAQPSPAPTATPTNGTPPGAS